VADRIANGARLTAQSWKALRENRQLLVFPLVSGAILTLITVVFVASLLGTGVVDGVTGADEEARSSSTILGLVQLFLFYLACYIVVIFSNTALVGAVLRLADGQSASAGDGFRVAVRRLPVIVVYALISATIGLLARGIAQSGRSSNNILVAIVAALVGALVQGAWTLVVFFAIPVIVAEGLGPVASLKRSLEIFRGTWGEAFTGQAVIGGISCLAYLLVILGAGAVIGLGVAQAIPALIVIGIVGAIVLFAALALLSGAVNGVFQASLYRYATSGDAGALIDTADAAAAFRVDEGAISLRV
jgi:hypothetical protein